MERFLGKYSAYLYALLRIVAGLMFAMHGSQKLFALPASGQPGPEPGSLVWVAGLIEIVTGVMIAIGLLGGYAAFLASGLMAAAFFKAHFSVESPLPIVNRGELAVLYCFVFLYMASHGSGTWSLDSLTRRPTANTH